MKKPSEWNRLKFYLYGMLNKSDEKLLLIFSWISVNICILHNDIGHNDEWEKIKKKSGRCSHNIVKKCNIFCPCAGHFLQHLIQHTQHKKAIQTNVIDIIFSQAASEEKYCIDWKYWINMLEVISFGVLYAHFIHCYCCLISALFYYESIVYPPFHILRYSFAFAIPLFCLFNSAKWMRLRIETDEYFVHKPDKMRK